MSVKNYNPADVDIILGDILVTGIADGTFVTVARANDSYTLAIGSSGEGARAKSNDRSGTIVVTLMQNSATNDEFSELALLDELSDDGVRSLMVRDRSGTTLHQAETAWIVKPSDSEGAKEITNREWTIMTDNLDMFVGGN